MELDPTKEFELSALDPVMQSFAHVERWERGPGFTIPEPKGMILGVGTHTCAFFIVFFETKEGKKAPIEPDMVPMLVKDASNAFEAVGATGKLGGLIEAYFRDVDPDACAGGERADADQLVLFRDQDSTQVLSGNFDKDRHPDACRVIRLSADQVCESDRSVAWAMPCFMRVE
jgi:hypothetical protein